MTWLGRWLVGWVGILLTAAAATAQGTWTEAVPLRIPSSDHTATLLLSGEVLVAGRSCELYDPRTGLWTVVASLATPRSFHTATLLPSGKVLVTGGSDDGSLASAELYDPQTGSWEEAGNLATSRYGHTATLLRSGKVLVAGGWRTVGGGGRLSSVELYDPDAGTWEVIAPLAAPRYLHTATLLLSGKVLVAGGGDGDEVGSVEIYDPTNGAWESAASLITPRQSHTATLLPSGKVLVAGGREGGNFVIELAEAELFDPIAGTWDSTASLATARTGHTATLLPTGEVIVVGGRDNGELASSEIYDPSASAWRASADLTIPRESHAATLLPSGRVLVAGGRDGDPLSSAELFDMGPGTWRNVADLATLPRNRHSASVLHSGQVLVVGGEDGSTYRSGAELYDPGTAAWGATGSLSVARSSHTATLLPSGQVLVAGGYNGAALASTELYDPDQGTWESSGNLASARTLHTAALLPTGEVLIAGGYDNSSLSSAEVYDPASGSWGSAASMAEPRISHSATLLHSGKVLVAGGRPTSTLSDARSTAELYDPATDTWENTGSLLSPRHSHTATLLPSGKVLVTGGFFGAYLSTAEIYDPVTGTWEPAARLGEQRSEHVATLLPSGKVLVTGGLNSSTSTELYDPSTGTWEATGHLASVRHRHTATLLFSGEILAAGGVGVSAGVSAELYGVDRPVALPVPVIQSASPTLHYDDTLTVTGSFRGDFEASSGDTRSSAVNYPLLHLRSLEGADQAWLVPDARPNFSDDPMALTVSRLPDTLHPGTYFLSVLVAGVASEQVPVEVECSLVVATQPEDVVAEIGATATFRVETRGGRNFQWQRDGLDIPNATGPSYTTSLITAADAGSTYRVLVGSGCVSQFSEGATLVIVDATVPTAEIVTPDGGEYWNLSDPSTGPETEVVAWTMSDDIRVCRVDVDLLFSNDSGQTWLAGPSGGGLPATFGQGGACPFPGVETSSLGYAVPTEPPSGQTGSLYKIRVRVTDQAGNVTAVESAHPFFMVRANPDSVRSLILHNLPRMRSIQGVTQSQADALTVNLHDLANHPRVQGHLVDLGFVGLPYAEWDADPSDPSKANDVVLALRDYLRGELLPTYTGVEYLVLVGDDRIIPMARLADLTKLPEVTYTHPVEGGLTAAGSTVGQALAANRYLTDDLLAVSGPLDLPLTQAAFDDGAFLPDLAVGRLVETPGEIVTTIATFISQDGILDLGSLGPDDHQIQVTGYDFLIDSGKKVCRRWRQALGVVPTGCDPTDIAPVDGQLLSPTWGTSLANRPSLLFDHLAGNAGEPYRILSLNGHATHFEEGVPGNDPTHITGLPAASLQGAVDLSGSVIYAVGCHGGLPVPGIGVGDADNSLDLPQTFLGQGALAYVANTGYGWGLTDGIGLSERLVEIFTEELTAGGTVAVGKAVSRSKERYFLDLPRFDPYDEKTLLQWTLFGLPMYAVKTGVAVAGESASVVSVQRRLERKVSELPDHVTRLDLHFDFSAAGLYRKYGAQGDELDAAVPGCGDPGGCYYTLNDLVERGTGTPDLPIQPYFVYDSRLSGTRQHGALWLGGEYREEEGWIAVIGELASNGGELSDHGTTPKGAHQKQRVTRRRRGIDGTCGTAETDLASLVVVTGEAFKDDESGPFTRQRIFRSVDLEVLYFLEPGSAANCDLDGPAIDPPAGGEYHTVRGATIEWSIGAGDVQADVWRVVVVYDLGPDEQGRGAWRPVELEYDALTERWEGSLYAPQASRLTYMVQAVDTRGNVSWVDYVVSEDDLPASGVALDLPLPMEAVFAATSADLSLLLSDAPDPATPQDVLVYTATVLNGGPDPATQVRVSGVLPTGVSFLGSSPPWDCDAVGSAVTCELSSLGVGAASILRIFTQAAVGGTVVLQVTVSAFEVDPDDGDNTAAAQTFVAAGADLWITKSDGGGGAVAGAPIEYTVTAGNDGPEEVLGAVVTDVFPAQIESVTWQCLASPGSSCVAAGTGNVNAVVDLAAGGTATFSTTGTVASWATGPIENTATITAATPPDPLPINNAATVLTLPEGLAPIFADGFESGDVSRWSISVGEEH